MKFAAIADWADQGVYPVVFMCRELQVSTSGYYKWRSHRVSARHDQDDLLMGLIRHFHASSPGQPGVRRIHAELAAGRGGGCVGGRCGGVRRVFGLVLTGLVCERGAQLRTQVREHAAFQCAADLLSQRPPALGRKALEQGRDLGRMHSLQQLAHTLVAAVDERLDHLLTGRMRARFLSRAGDVVVMAGFVVHAPKDTRPQAAARRGRGALTAPAR